MQLEERGKEKQERPGNSLMQICPSVTAEPSPPMQLLSRKLYHGMWELSSWSRRRHVIQVNDRLGGDPVESPPR